MSTSESELSVFFQIQCAGEKKVKRKQSKQLQSVGKSRTEQHKASLSLHVVSILCCRAEPHPLAHQKTREAPPMLCHTSTRTRREGGEKQNEEQRETVPYLSAERLTTESNHAVLTFPCQRKGF